MPYFHVVCTLPSELRDIAYQNKRVVDDLLNKGGGRDDTRYRDYPKRLGARIGGTAVLHTGLALTHHPHVHMIVPGGQGFSLDDAMGRLPLRLSVALSVAAGGSPGRTDGRSLRREIGRRDDRENEPDLRRERGCTARCEEAFFAPGWPRRAFPATGRQWSGQPLLSLTAATTVTVSAQPSCDQR